MAINNPLKVVFKAMEMPWATTVLSLNPVRLSPLKRLISPLIVPTNPSSGAMPTMISSTTRPRSICAISCRARVWMASAFSPLGQFRCSTATSSNRPNADGCCWQIPCSMPRSSLVRHTSSAFSTSGGMIFFQRNASPRSMMKARPTMEVGTNRNMTGPPSLRNCHIHSSIGHSADGQSSPTGFYRQAGRSKLIVKREYNVPVIFRDGAAHIARPGRIRRGIRNPFLAIPGQHVAHLGLQHFQFAHATVRMQPELQYHLARARRGGRCIEDAIPSRRNGADDRFVVGTEWRRLGVKRGDGPVPFDAAFLFQFFPGNHSLLQLRLQQRARTFWLLLLLRFGVFGFCQGQVTRFLGRLGFRLWFDGLRFRFRRRRRRCGRGPL